MEMMLEQLIDLYRQYQSHVHIGGGAAMLVAVCAFAVAKLDREKLFAYFEKCGVAIDKLIVLKLAILEKQIDAAIINGLIVITVAVTYGIVKNCESMKLKLKETLTWLAGKI